jgi:hypothetical protein
VAAAAVFCRLRRYAAAGPFDAVGADAQVERRAGDRDRREPSGIAHVQRAVAEVALRVRAGAGGVGASMASRTGTRGMHVLSFEARTAR